MIFVVFIIGHLYIERFVPCYELPLDYPPWQLLQKVSLPLQPYRVVHRLHLDYSMLAHWNNLGVAYARLGKVGYT